MYFFGDLTKYTEYITNAKCRYCVYGRQLDKTKKKKKKNEKKKSI